MRQIISEKITKSMLANGIIKEEDSELYAYGFHDIIMLIATMLPVLIVAVIFNMAFLAILYVVAFLPLRIFGGGYHADTEERCYVASVIQMVLVVFVIKWLPWSPILCLSLLAVSGIIVFFLAPLEHKNRPLSTNEVVVYKRRARLFLVAEIIVVIGALALGFIPLAATVLMAPVTASISMTLAVVKEHLSKEVRVKGEDSFSNT